MASDRSFGLDLWRATAIMLVLVAHWSSIFGPWFGIDVPQAVFFAGSVGVELFFVLSGFLIGRILIEIAGAAPTPRNLGIFLLRRTMRTLPLYILCVVVLSLFVHTKMHNLLHFLTLTQNLVTTMPPDGFFAVSWSLTVEEWFYLLFGSLFLLPVWLGCRTGVALWMCTLLFISAPLALRVALYDWSQHTWYVNKEVFFRIDEIAYGVLMAWLYLRRSVLFRHPLICALPGLTLIALTWAIRLPVPVALIPALMPTAMASGAALCLPAACALQAPAGPFSKISRWLSARSYAIYLLHFNIMVDFVQTHLWATGALAPPLCVAVAMLLPFGLAELSWRFIEQPILRARPVQSLR